MSNVPETPIRTLWVALIVCAVCSIVVCSAAFFLQQKQANNRQLDRQRSILEVAGLSDNRLSASETLALFEKRIEPRLVNLQTGQFSNQFDIKYFNDRDAANDEALSIDLDRVQDTASIGRRENYTIVYLVKDNNNQLERIILPVRGAGAWGPIIGLIALGSDFRTTTNVIFYDHSETPGLGGEIDNPAWRRLWNGVQVIDESNRVALEITQNRDPNSSQAIHQIDALAGATVTSNFVNQLVNFWLGEQGFGPFLNNLRQGVAQ